MCQKKDLMSQKNFRSYHAYVNTHLAVRHYDSLFDSYTAYREYDDDSTRQNESYTAKT